jgi:hypothetical protein
MRGLLCIEPLYHQIVKGNKTQTRRSGGLEEVNVQGIPGDSLWDWSPDDWSICESDIGIFEFHNKKEQSWAQCKPRYKVGEVLYLKEPIREVNGVGDTDYTQYAYSTNVVERSMVKWSNKLFMPCAAARAFVKITGIRCERLTDISEHDAIAEGIEVLHGTPIGTGYKNYESKDLAHTYKSAVNSFMSLFRFANKIKLTTVEPNPWVWVYEFIYLKNYKP